MANLSALKTLGIVVLILASIVLIMMAVLTDFSYILRDDTSTTIVNYAIPAENTSFGVGTTGQYPYLQAMTGCVNSSGGTALATTSYTITEGDANGGNFTLTNNAVLQSGDSINCSTLTYLADSDAQSSADTFHSGMAIFATFIGVIILAVIGMVMIRIFAKK